MKKIVAFSKYLSYVAGGAERSTIEILRQQSRMGTEIQVVSVAGARFTACLRHRSEFPSSWSCDYITPRVQLRRFFYLECILNRSRVTDYFAKQPGDDAELYTYGVWAPPAINAFPGKATFFVRSETDLGINANYGSGAAYFGKFLYTAAEYPVFALYMQDLRKAIARSDVVANSHYMASLVQQRFGKAARVLYPFVDGARLKDRFASINQTGIEKGIVFVGDSVRKGLRMVLALARRFPRERFYIFSRRAREPKQESNVVWMPWQQDEIEVYKYAKAVIVPSIWREAYGRVAREAYLLELPVLVSAVGGLPETVDRRADLMVPDIHSVAAWEKKLRDIL